VEEARQGQGEICFLQPVKGTVTALLGYQVADAQASPSFAVSLARLSVFEYPSEMSAWQVPLGQHTNKLNEALKD